MLPGISPTLRGQVAGAQVVAVYHDPYFHAYAIYTSASEGKIASLLDSCLEKFPNLMLGSYPKIGNAEYRVKLTLESEGPRIPGAGVRRYRASNYSLPM